ncbi:LysR family transcriptional regulator [Bradyrhizobium sp. U87765 SZCCT0131]|uniref:LysR family transcriptional regulator n=1 Tax=unclassified Bradyrhizobium TaxID=2631580 RepID=UPI001BA90068|nr:MULTISPECIES: LysR family transcriptional regulator [unclassified Bradyrhizobium]MBR1218771.1 LysR family transcriptional regulator [Bradyrhizobium sp. U87765 SZCCT0131]MBR1265470.1 LysR family transcriptional regulator [Bradyrhizobium sp. U87765 SZCCT0134]MBR1304270.1 LysR family transcriptional regulator [Bradyrhizobium sp. U87765 SZCCT0110]MBR1319875.1 LysR family transcriptional regulator [Bradyrhizobium sp. U87765 SZCCT0109]MBR1348201.1 LysR family transcriptional regulator [Bradyrhizo
MDRIDAMKVFVSAVDEGSLAGAGRRLRRSPAAVSRAIAFLEAHVGSELLHRTTRSLKLSEAGERYAAACRRVLTELEEADLLAGGEKAAPRGTLTLTAPVITGEDVLRPVLDAFMDEYPTVSVRLLLLDRPVNLIDEGIDVALRIAHLPDSSFVATKLGEVRRVVAAAPGYLAQHPVIGEPADLAKQRIIAMTHFGIDSWSFPPRKGSSVPRTVQFAPRLVVNTVRAAVASAAEGHGVTRLFSYHIAEEIRDGRLQILLAADEHPPLPVHLLAPQGRFGVPKVRAFVDFAVPRLKRYFERLSREASHNAGAMRARRTRRSAR